MLLVPNGPGKGTDLVLVDGLTPQKNERNAAKKLWYDEELMQHMLSPKGKTKSGNEPRTDFSPTRKEIFKGCFQISAKKIAKKF